MKAPKNWTKNDLYQHLQHAVDVEFFTIPLYLSALYSIKGLDALKPKDYPESAKLILSVVIQEMLHLEIACNLCHALGYKPKLNAPDYSSSDSIPFIHPKKEHLPEQLRDYSIQIRELGEHSLKAFCVIELPQKAMNLDWEHKRSYESIAEMYLALREGINHFWESCYVGSENNNFQKSVFSEYATSHFHVGYSQTVNSLEDAHQAIESIIEQGEGAHGSEVALAYQPPKLKEGEAFNPGWFEGELCHYRKFSLLLNNLEHLPKVYELNEQNEVDQSAFKSAYASFLSELQLSFQTQGMQMSDAFWSSMMKLNQAITEVYKQGNLPNWN